ncbi:universal stress protein [candidate division GN15 bacterium]|nr:universal stress protein [candidate division GN15 bacterium]
MAIPTLNAVGFCAHYSKPGDWAFDYALRLSRLHQIKLNVFHFLSDPYDPNDDAVENMPQRERARLAIEREKELRLYYDQRAGDYLDVGFRLCEHAEWVELHRCLLVREFQVLVLGYVSGSCSFGHRPIEEFAEAFISPVVLVGPNSADEFRLNSRAALIAGKLGLDSQEWLPIQTISA